jgi:hypothetical protein
VAQELTQDQMNSLRTQEEVTELEERTTDATVDLGLEDWEFVVEIDGDADWGYTITGVRLPDDDIQDLAGRILDYMGWADWRFEIVQHGNRSTIRLMEILYKTPTE